MVRSKRTLGKVATRILLENDRVRIWELVLAPGQSSDWHHHILDYVTVATTAGTTRMEMEDGAVSENSREVGAINFRKTHQPHVVTNIGKNITSNILIELKE